jgi:integrase
MDEKWFVQSATMLRAVLGGATYETAARDHALTRTAVERRVKALVLELVRSVGVDGINEAKALFVRTLRSHRVAIESALAQFKPQAKELSPAGSIVLSDEGIDRALARVRSRTSTPERDVAMVWILVATGLRPLEVARMVVRDFLNDDGSVRSTFEVRADVAVNGRPRALYFSSAEALNATDAYLYRRATVAGAYARFGRLRGPFRGLGGDAPLFLNQTGHAFQVRSIPSARGARSICQQIHYEYRKIFRRIGVPGLTAGGARYTLVNRLQERGAKRRQIGDLLGVRRLRPPKVAPAPLNTLMKSLL